MKLIRLKINDSEGFRSLPSGFEILFNTYVPSELIRIDPYVLIGPNGSGKSNILEALAAIFYHLECIYLNYRPESFEFDEENNIHGFRSNTSSPNAFEVEYLFPVKEELINDKSNEKYAHIEIIKKMDETPIFNWVNRNQFDNSSTMLERKEIRHLLPDFVIGYSSGDNEILSLPFFKMRFLHFDESIENFLRQLSFNVPEGRLTFLNRDFSQAILLSNFLFQQKEVLSPFEKEVNIEDIKSFTLTIKKSILIDQKIIPSDMVKDSFQDFNNLGSNRIKFDISSGLKSIIEKFVCCSTSSYYDEHNEELHFYYWVNNETKESFRHYFESPIELFQTFQILLTLNFHIVSEESKKKLYQSNSLYVNEFVPYSPEEKVFNIENLVIKTKTNEILFKALSDGEYQFIHILGLCLLYNNTNSLFLLDEPETHFNPIWRSNFISRVRDCFNPINKNKLSEILITTHSPFLVSDSRKEFVLIFEKNNNISVVKPDYNTLGASVNKITMSSFKQTRTIGGHAAKILDELNQKFLENGPSQELIDKTNELLGDSVEKTLFIKKLIYNSKDD